MARRNRRNKKSFSMLLTREKTFSINGTIHGVEMSHDEFLEEFVEFIEAKGWNFIGHTQRLTEGEAMKHTRNYLLDHDLSKDPNDEE